jgi:hypothetical protein
MEIDGPTATIIAASVALMLAIMGFIGVVNSRLGKLEAGQQALSEKVDTHHSENLRMHEETRAENARRHEETRADIRRVLDALVTHSHDADGPVFFRIPPGTDPEN